MPFMWFCIAVTMSLVSISLFAGICAALWYGKKQEKKIQELEAQIFGQYDNKEVIE